jgi:hypothetical protein
MLFQPDHHLGSQCQDPGFGRFEAKIKEYVAAAFDATRVRCARIGFSLHRVAPIIR